METTKKQKTFDAVKMMREIREKITAETQNMSFEELKVYIKTQLEANKKQQTRQTAPGKSK